MHTDYLEIIGCIVRSVQVMGVEVEDDAMIIKDD